MSLLPELVDYRLKRQPDSGQCDVGGFGAQSVGLAVEFLRQEIELAPHAFALGDQHTRVLDMGGQPVKGVLVFNRWAAMAMAPPITLLSLDPVVIDITDCKIQVTGGDFEVLRCQ